MVIHSQLQVVSTKKKKLSDNFFTAHVNWMDGLISELMVSINQDFLGTQELVFIAVNHQDDDFFLIEI